jgi:hypothetical protein
MKLIKLNKSMKINVSLLLNFIFQDLNTKYKLKKLVISICILFSLFQDMKVNWVTSTGNQPKQDTSSTYH